MSGTSSSSTSIRTVSATHGASSEGTKGLNLARSASQQNGRSTTGPTPGRMDTPKPTEATGTMMSEKSTAASTP
jgi:hypothetical protein